MKLRQLENKLIKAQRVLIMLYEQKNKMYLNGNTRIIFTNLLRLFIVEKYIEILTLKIKKKHEKKALKIQKKAIRKNSQSAD